MPIYKNVASQKLAVFAWDTGNDTEKTGDAANITAQISKDGAAMAAVGDTNPTELDATNAPGVYVFDLAQAETNADLVIVFSKSSTTGIKIEPVIAYTTPVPNDVSASEVETAAAAAITGLGGLLTIGEVESAVASLATSAEIAALENLSAADAAAAVLAAAVEGTLDIKAVLRVLLASAAGKASGGGTTTIAFRDAADTKDRISMTVDANGDRSAVTIDGTD